VPAVERDLATTRRHPHPAAAEAIS